MNKNKQIGTAVALLTATVFTTGMSMYNVVSTVKDIQTINDNKKILEMNNTVQKDYAELKMELNHLSNVEIDTISLSAVYYLISLSKADIVVTGISTSDSMATTTTLVDQQPQTTDATTEAPQTTDATTEAPQTPTAEAPQTPAAEVPTPAAPTDTPQPQPTEGQQSAIPSAEQPAEEPTPELPKTRTGNSSVNVSLRGDVKTLLTYLDTTKLNYLIVSYENHNGIETCSLEIRR